MVAYAGHGPSSWGNRTFPGKGAPEHHSSIHFGPWVHLRRERREPTRAGLKSDAARLRAEGRLRRARRMAACDRKGRCYETTEERKVLVCTACQRFEGAAVLFGDVGVGHVSIPVWTVRQAEEARRPRSGTAASTGHWRARPRGGDRRERGMPIVRGRSAESACGGGRWPSIGRLASLAGLRWY